MTVSVKVLGSGCRKCEKLFEETRRASEAAGVDVELTKVTELDEIMGYGVMMTPALVINEEVKSSGRIPSQRKMIAWLKAT